MRLSYRKPSRILTRLAIVMAIAGTGLWAPAPAQAQGVGVSPTSIALKEAFRGVTRQETLILSNENSGVNVQFTIAASGEIAPWLTFARLEDGKLSTPATTFVVPSKARVFVGVSVAVPATAPNRTYSGTIEVVGEADEAGRAGGAGVGLAVNVPMSVEVSGTERRAGTVSDMFVLGAEVGQNQRFNALIKNTGNVQIMGQVDVQILRDGKLVAEISSKGTNFPIVPNHDGLVVAEWPTSDQNSGNYTAQFRVLDVGGSAPKEMGTKSVPFRLEPRGTLTRGGAFEQLKLLNEPEVGGVAKAAAVFLNTGKIDTRAVFSGEVYRNGRLVQSVTSLEKLVKQASRELVEMNIDVPEAGTYRLVGKMNFEGVETEVKELEFTVGSVGGDGGSSLPLILGAAGGAVVIALVVIVMLRRRSSGPPPQTERMRERERLGV